MSIKGYELSSDDKERIRREYDKLMPLVNRCRLDGYEGLPVVNHFNIEEAMPAVVAWHRQGAALRELGPLQFLFSLDTGASFYEDRYKTA